ncbi:MAG: ribonuclease H-like YkuK family protein [bacterium]|nr:ribonuclease H-like YkuK family protein [bacterium]
MPFVSPSKGPLSFDRVYEDILAYIGEMPEAGYRLIVGTDSHSRDDVHFVTAIIIHRRGKGARYYYERRRHAPMAGLRQRLYHETALSLQVGSQLAERLARGHLDVELEIHLDVGQNGATRELIREIVGWVAGSGFDAKIKPEAYGASKVADKHTK